MNFGDKFNQAEIDDIFGEFEVDDDGFLESKAVIGLFVAGGGEEKKEEEKKEEAPAPAADDAAPAEEGGKKKRRKKRRRKKLQLQLLMMLPQLKREARRKRRRRLPSKLVQPKYTFIFSNLLNSNLYVKCFYIPSSRLILSIKLEFDIVIDTQLYVLKYSMF